MASSDDLDDSMRSICSACVDDSFLSSEIKQSGSIARCSYCGEDAEAWDIEDLADRIEVAFDEHYYRTSDQPNSWQEHLLADRESRYIWVRDGMPVLDAIESAAGIPSDAAGDVLEILSDRHSDFEAAKMGEETEFDPDSYYEEKGQSDQEWQAEWKIFEQSLKKEARFFSRVAASHLTSIFGGIDGLKTSDGRPLVVEAGPDTELDQLYRARVFQSDGKLKEALCRPDLHIGPPPANSATAGRMNARGISVFYGATEASVAISEVRPPVGSKVAVATFSVLRNLRLLDLTALEAVHDDGSIFDPTLKGRLERVAFLRSLGKRMTKPVMPDDEAFDYLATQAIADFLATENEPLLDGIIFGSVQAGNGCNVILFHKAALVEAMEFPEGTEIEAQCGYHTEDGWEADYSVSERTPPLLSPAPECNHLSPFHLAFPDTFRPEEYDPRKETLRIDAGSVEVHEVNWVEYHSTPHRVARYRHEKRDWKF